MSQRVIKMSVNCCTEIVLSFDLYIIVVTRIKTSKRHKSRKINEKKIYKREAFCFDELLSDY